MWFDSPVIGAIFGHSRALRLCFHTFRSGSRFHSESLANRRCYSLVLSHQDHVAERANRIFTLWICCQLTLNRNRSEQLALFVSNEFQFKPAEDLINDGLGVADLGRKQASRNRSDAGPPD